MINEPLHSPIIFETPSAAAVALGMDDNQYREYLSWRIDLQTLCFQLVTYEKETSEDIKASWQIKIYDQLETINRRATQFPMQPLPDNLRASGDYMGLSVPGASGDVWCLPNVQMKLISMFDSAISTVDTPREISG